MAGSGGRAFRILILADFHIGSMFSLWPPGFKTSLGTEVSPNVGQKYLLDHWRKIIAAIPQYDLLVLNGDMVDGTQPKSYGRFILEPEPIVQAQAALEVIRPVMKKLRAGGRVIVMRGTPYHEEDDAACELIGEALNALPTEYGRRSWGWLVAECGGLIVDIAHSQSYMMRYRSTALEREGQFSDMAGLNADIIIRSHTHSPLWAYVEGGGRRAFRLEITTPPMQIASEYANRSKTPNRTLPKNLGVMVVEIPRDGLPVVRPYVFPHPPLQRKTVIKEIVGDGE